MNKIEFDFEQLKSNTLNFIDKCYPSSGVFNSELYERSSENSVLSKGSEKFIKNDNEIIIVEKTLQERIKENDWAFSSTPGGCESIEASHSALETYYFYDMLHLLSKDNKCSWIDYFNSFQDKETGYYSSAPFIRSKEHRNFIEYPACTHPWYHMQDHVLNAICPALIMLGGKSKYKLSSGSMTGRFLDKQYLIDYIYNRNWNNYEKDGNYKRHNPWWVGNELWHAAFILWTISKWEKGTTAATQARLLLDEVWYKFHDENFGINGFWYGDLKGKVSNLWYGSLKPSFSCRINDAKSEQEYEWHNTAVMGGAHQLWFYDFENKCIPDEVRKAQTDTVLAIQNINDYHFGLAAPYAENSNACNCSDIDCMTILAYNYHKQDYRREEIEKALALAANAILSDRINKDGVLVSSLNSSFAHHSSSYETFSRKGDANLLDQSFYLWAIRAAANGVKKCNDKNLETILAHNWPVAPTNWLWLP